MNITLWILQVLLALAFLAHGVMFLAPPPEIGRASCRERVWIPV